MALQASKIPQSFIRVVIIIAAIFAAWLGLKWAAPQRAVPKQLEKPMLPDAQEASAFSSSILENFTLQTRTDETQIIFKLAAATNYEVDYNKQKGALAVTFFNTQAAETLPLFEVRAPIKSFAIQPQGHNLHLNFQLQPTRILKNIRWANDENSLLILLVVQDKNK